MCYCGMTRYGHVPHPIVGQLNTAAQVYNVSWHNLQQNPLHMWDVVCRIWNTFCSAKSAK